MKKLTLIFIVLLLCSLTFSCQKQQASSSTKTHLANQTVTSTQAKLLFFMNPAGYPCQMQDQILTAMKSELEKKVKLTYFKTSIHQDREKFYAYGIRALPALILIDKTGNEVKRFPPGIQSKESIINSISELK